VTSVPFAYTVGMLAIDKRAFNRISAADQAIVREVLTGVYEVFEERNRQDNLDAEQALRTSGLKFVEVDPRLVPVWRDIAAESNRKMAEQGVFSVKLLDEFLGHITDFHKGSDSDQAALNSAE
jgi:TRAP-type C4-dicarboxylate transport system substrate-binding protein